ncbi:MAG: DUF58 domain-containing protein [Myxococcota bacterium]
MDRERDRRSRRDSALRRARRRLRPPRSLRATRAGWCFVAIIFGVGFAALNTGNNLLYLVFALMLAFLVLSGVLSEASLRGIRIERHLPRELFAAATHSVVLRVHNDQRRVASFALTIEDRALADEGPRSVGRCFTLRVGPRSRVDRRYALAPERRGELVFDSLRVSTRFPFGLFVKSVELEAPGTALVYPAVHPLPIGAPTGDDPHEGEARPEPARGGDTIGGLRDHLAGDGLARVHWRRSLRAGRLVVGEREGEARARLEVLLQLPAGLPTPAIEQRISEAASQVVAHLEAGFEVGLRTRARRFAPATGAAHRRELLRFLARVTPAQAEGEPATVFRPAGAPGR